MTEDSAVAKLKTLKKFLENEIEQVEFQNKRLSKESNVGANIKIQRILECEKNKTRISTMTLVLDLIGEVK